MTWAKNADTFSVLIDILHSESCQGIPVFQHGISYTQVDTPDLVLQGIIPGIERHGTDPCNGCGYQLRHPTGLFCHVCGKYPARTL